MEYCESLFFDACESGRCKLDRRAGGEVISGGSGGWVWFGDNDAGAGEVDGDGVVDMTSVIVPELSPAQQRLAPHRLRSGSQSVWFRPMHTWQQATRYPKLRVRRLMLGVGEGMRLSWRRVRESNRGYIGNFNRALTGR